MIQYGAAARQRGLFAPTMGNLNAERHFHMTARDDCYPWLKERIQRFEIERRLEKPLRRETGEVSLLSPLPIPIQVAHDILLQVFQDEKSRRPPQPD
uniref:Uncharacterized protein n=1 Tax=Candidatus Kentrum sp. LPFa TaxID=2126335 RepID=A0A450WH50_9GAMM|nr:MAG: hypothetical protein BECKLPF1236B_GA0070989_10954 [Candidatus Kentron sp. LPFa]